MTDAVRKIIHVDMDAFFASVEQRDDPTLRGRPVAVGGSAARGVVAAASYEARVYGVRSAMPSVTAARRCPDLVFVRPRFEVYRQVSRAIRAIFLDYTPLVEPLSLDEAYLDVTANLRGLETATATAREIRARILAETGLTASAGISYNKFLAKLASDQRKPNGQYVIPPGAGAAYIAGLEVGRFHGIGPATAAKLQALGIRTGADLAAQELVFLQQRFGKSGGWYHAIARGIDHRPVTPDRARKSSGSETTFHTDRADWDGVAAGIRDMADDVWGWCERADATGRTVTVKAKYNDFRQMTRSRTVQDAIPERAMLHEVALGLARTLFPLRAPVRLVGVTLSTLVDRGGLPLTLDLHPPGFVGPGGGDDMPEDLNPGDQAAPGTPGTGEDICPRCNGSGTLNGGECPNCGGTGIVIEGIGGA